MKLITIIFVALTALISACSIHKDPTSRDSGTIGSSAQDTNIEPKESRVIANKPDQPSEIASADELDFQVNSENINNSLTTTVPIDLFERIRRGFKFPDIDSKYTNQYINWNVSHTSYLKDLFTRAEPFLYYIVEEIDKRGLPMELALLPAIESAFKPDALSRSKASGLWQFIPSTGKSFGLRQDWWYDGRRDFISSTNAALDYLSQLNTIFEGDWHLTLAAYNAGQGTVRRAIQANLRKNKPTNYQSLKLRYETVKYVPKLQALKEVVSNPEKYNVTLRNIANQPYFEIIELPGQIDLQQFSNLAKLDLKTIKHMNAGYLRWATSPNGPHRLLTPVTNHIQTQLALQEIKVSPSIEFQKHTIAQGETLSHISRRYGVSISALQKTNKMTSNNIRAGKTLIIPIAGNSVASNVTSTKYNSTTQRVHRVVKGDTLWSISKRYKVKLQELLSWNQLSKNHTLHLNQSLLIAPN